MKGRYSATENTKFHNKQKKEFWNGKAKMCRLNVYFCFFLALLSKSLKTSFIFVKQKVKLDFN